jgi:hypothetical protein
MRFGTIGRAVARGLVLSAIWVSLVSLAHAAPPAHSPAGRAYLANMAQADRVNPTLSRLVPGPSRQAIASYLDGVTRRNQETMAYLRRTGQWR